jgi:hypothetical protein
VGEVIHIRESTVPVGKDGAVSKMDDRITIKTGESRVVVERRGIQRIVVAPSPAATSAS